jgi:hypothetical protein
MASEDPVELPAQGLVTTRPHYGLFRQDFGKWFPIRT